jgi:hypothetical protein
MIYYFKILNDTGYLIFSWARFRSFVGTVMKFLVPRKVGNCLNSWSSEERSYDMECCSACNISATDVRRVVLCYAYTGTHKNVWNSWGLQRIFVAAIFSALIFGWLSIYNADLYLSGGGVGVITSFYKQTNSMVWVRERTTPTERPPLVGEMIANFCG